MRLIFVFALFLCLFFIQNNAFDMTCDFLNKNENSYWERQKEYDLYRPSSENSYRKKPKSFNRRVLAYSHQHSSTILIKACLASGFSVMKKNKILTSIDRETSETSRNRQNLIILSINYQTVRYMPKGIEAFCPNLEVLKITNSQLQEIDASDLEPFASLKELYLNGNSLIVLKNDLFEGNRGIEHLQFDSNSNLRYVGENIFDPLSDLKIVYFQNCGCINLYVGDYYSGTSLDSLKTNLRTQCPSFEKLKNHIFKTNFGDDIFELVKTVERFHIENSMLRLKVETLCDGNLSSKELEHWKKPIKMESYEVKHINLTCQHSYNGYNKECNVVKEFKVWFSNISVQNVLNSDSKAFNSTEMTVLKIDQQQTFFLPLNISSHFPKLMELSINSSGLCEINANIFKDMLSLSTLTLSNNKIIEIPSDTFHQLENLIKLDLSFNRIESLSNDVFRSLKNLEHLKFNDNNLKFISANLLSPLKQIATIDLSHNECINMSLPGKSQIEIETEFIDNCIAPIELNCSSDMKQVNLESSDNSFVCEVQNLVIEYPKTKIFKVVSASSDDFDPNNVTTLIIDHQSTKFLPYQLAKSFPQLEKIIVGKSKLTSLHRHDFEDFTQLKSIEIRHNNLSIIEHGTFDDVKQIENLDLSHNNIHSLPWEIFFNLVHVKTLILSHNQIKKLTADLLPRKNSIKEFKVDNNELELIETKILRYLRKAKIIDLTTNVCIDLKFDKTDEKSKTLVELSGEIDLNCSSDD